jgi:hypothetical protein
MPENQYVLVFRRSDVFLLTFKIGAIFNLLKSKKELLIQSCLQKKEIEVLLR